MERRRRRQQHARADGFGRGGAAAAQAAAALSARARRLPAQLERGQVQGSVAARGRAAAVASRRAARARRGGQVIGRRVMGRRVTAPSDRRRRADRRSAAADLEGVRSATVGVGGRPSCGEEGGRQVRVVRVALHRPVERTGVGQSKGPVGAGEAGEIRCEIRFAPKQVWTLCGRAEKPTRWKGGYWGGQFTPRGTTYVFVNVVVAPRYVARLRLGSGGL